MKAALLAVALVLAAGSARAADDRWGMDEVAASRTVLADEAGPKAWEGDPPDLLAVVEAGDDHLSILDGANLRPLARIATRHDLRGRARASPDGRFLYVLSADGWVAKIDLLGQRVVAETRAGLDAANLALSHDGRFLMVANGRPHTLVSLDAVTLAPIRVMAVADRKGNSSAVAAIHTVPHRKSFMAELVDFKEIWELPYNEDHEPIYNGFVHSREKDMVEGFAEPGPFPARKIKTGDFLGAFVFTRGGRDLAALGRDGTRLHALNLLTGTEYAELALPDQPRLGQAFLFARDGRDLLAIPHGGQGLISIVDAKSWRMIKTIATLGEAVSVSGHDGSRRLWVTFAGGKDADAIQILDLDRLEMAQTLRPAPGRPIGSVAFDRRGRVALVTVMEADGAVIALDTDSLEQVGRQTMRLPTRSYDVSRLVDANLP